MKSITTIELERAKERGLEAGKVLGEKVGIRKVAEWIQRNLKECGFADTALQCLDRRHLETKLKEWGLDK